MIFTVMSSGGFFAGNSPDFEMLEADQLSLHCTGDNWEEYIDLPTRRRWILGEGGGCITFDPEGTVRVWWDRKAAIAATYASGGRKTSITQPGEKGMPPQFDELFNSVGACRRFHGADGSKCPEDPKDPRSATFMRLSKKLSWKMLRAVADGDFNFLHAVAEHLENYEKLAAGDLEMQTEDFDDLAAALETASRKKGGIPTRLEVSREFNALVPNNRHRDVRYKLTRMGFGWLPAPLGKPKGEIRND